MSMLQKVETKSCCFSILTKTILRSLLSPHTLVWLCQLDVTLPNCSSGKHIFVFKTKPMEGNRKEFFFHEW